MTKTPCKHCDKPTDGYLCHPCLKLVTSDLTRVPWLVNQLYDTLARQDRRSAAAPSAHVETEEGADEHGAHRYPLPFDTTAGDRIDGLVAALTAAVRTLEPIRDNWPGGMLHSRADDRRKAVAAAQWLNYRADDLRRRPDGPTLAKAIQGAYARALATINRDRGDFFGPCTAGVPVCDTDLHAQPGSAVVQCRKCGTTYDAKALRLELLVQAEDQLVNATDLARAVTWLDDNDDERVHTLTRDRIYQWAKRGRITAKAWHRCPDHMHDAIPPACKGCQPLYRVGDAIDLLANDTRKTR